MRYLITFIALFIGFNSFGGVETYSDRLEGSNITSQPFLEVYDSRYFDMENSNGGFPYTNYRVKNIVQLGYIENDFPQLDEQTTVTINIEWWEYQQGSFVQFSETRDLTIEYFQNEFSQVDDKSSFVFDYGHRIQVTIIDVQGSLDHVYLEASVEVERYYDMDQLQITNYGFNAINYSTVSNGIEPTISVDPITSQDYSDPRIEFWWNEIVGAEEYELEWTFVSNYDFDNSLNGGLGGLTEVSAAFLGFDFYENSTRIQLTENHYEIPGLFNRGYIVYRVRPIGRQGVNFDYRYEGDWSYMESGSVFQFATTVPSGVIQIAADYESGKNWSHSVSYTEGGKRFEGVSYTDGFGRGRQSLSHNAATDQVVINNAYYDKAGRPVISDLPTPSDREDLSFRKYFNHIMVNGVAEPMNLDNYLIDADNCVIPNPFSTSLGHGAGAYYSSTNPDQSGANAHIPDANGYPFSKAVYRDDPTGRIREVGGVGLELQPTQHSTKMFYETPTQDELNRLFGTEVGLKEHYQKTITSDANGQVYVQYTDLAGRVIASGVAGDSPTNLDQLANNLGDEAQTNTVYTAALDNNLDPTIAEYSYNRVILKDGGTISLSHEFDPAVFINTNCINGICFDCHYDFEINVTRIDCPQNPPIIYEISLTMSGAAIDQACNLTTYDAPNALPISSNTFPISNLDAGEYVITKSLKISEDISEAYWCEYIDNADPTCTPDYNVIYNDLYDNTDFGCDPYSGATVQSSSYCDFKRQQLITDLSVGGQYGLVSDGVGGIDPSIHPLSIYNGSNSLTGSNQNDWQFPTGNYLNDDGSIAVIYLTMQGNTYSPTPNDPNDVQFDAGGLAFIYPDQLANVEDFIFYAQPSWAEALISYHPEICYLEFCETYGDDFHTYSTQLDAVQTFDQACAGGYFEPLGNTTISIPAYNGCVTPTTEDIFFTSGYFSGVTAQWAETNYSCVPVLNYSATSNLTEFYDLGSNNYLSLWEYAVWQVSCSSQTSYLDIISCVNNTVIDDCNKELIWQNFKQGYESLRDEAFLFAQTAYVSYPVSDPNIGTGGGCGNGHNGCIGGTITPTTCFDPYKYEPGNVSVNQDSPCSSAQAILYRNKASRFSNYTGDTPALPLGYDFTTEVGVQQYYDDQLVSICESSCASQADGWMEQLIGCGLDPTQLTAIRNGFIEVCEAGCDGTNLQGASDLTNATNTSSTPNGYTSFDNVLQTILGAGYESTICSNLLISTPAPYGANTLQVMQSPLDECGCDKVLQAKYDFGSNTDPLITSVADQLMVNEGIQYDVALSLACACEQEYFDSHATSWTPNAVWNVTSVNNLTSSGITIPNTFSCSSVACQDCASMNTLNTSFVTRFGSNVDQDPNYELLLQNYMNFGLSYNLSAEQYIAFLEVCNATSINPVCATTQVTPVLVDMIDVIIRRGKLTNTNADILDNIVYENSTIGQFFIGTNYSGTVIGDNLTMAIGDATITLNIPSGSDFTFDDILSIYNFTPVQCGANNDFTLMARVMNCGIVEDRIISGQTADFDLVNCYCGGTAGVLCNSSTGGLITSDCYKDELVAINSISLDQYSQELATSKDQFISDYTAQCVTAFDTEVMTETSDYNLYQFTLFYYDQAGNLIQTVAPEGIDEGFKNGADFINIDDNRDDEVVNVPDHKFRTIYEYNSYNQLVSTTNPDQDGDTEFWYDSYGRIIASQNPVQANELKFSYSLYDVQGRSVEVGQVSRITEDGIVVLFPFAETQIKQDDLGVWFKNWVYGGVRSEVTLTTYDLYPDVLTAPKFKQTPEDKNLRLRVSSVRYYAGISGGTNYDTDYESANYYNYDQHGNVLEYIQDIPQLAVVAQDIKSTQYEFELISGNVEKVMYQKDELDQFTHEYHYDKLNRLTEVFTTRDDIHKSREAHYHYYDYGPLARTEIGQHKVQGQDFAYTINGWLKGMNASSLDKTRDIGKDGNSGYLVNNGSAHSSVAKDINGYTIGYFNADYSAIGSSSMEMTHGVSDGFHPDARQLYNGNIQHLVTSIFGMETMGTAYEYDQLQRLTEMTAFKNTNTDNSWTGISSTLDYYNAYTYDKNGNMLTLERNGFGSQLNMDDMSYSYTTVGGEMSNRLDHVIDDGIDYQTGGVNNFGDIISGEDQNGLFSISKIEQSGNFKYDEIGELIEDGSENIASIVWRRGDKKMKTLTRLNGITSPDLEFIYNPFGVRIIKIEKTKDSYGAVASQDQWNYTYYSHDANGQTMAVYDLKMSQTNSQARIDEHHIYGASRLGILKEGCLIFDNGPIVSVTSDIYQNILGDKRYELTNHLGNVQAVISDRKTWNATDLNYEAAVVLTSDYYPFGMQMPGRHTEQESYRYAYNGMEVDNEVSGNGNSYTTEFRQYDPRLGRWKSLDPLMAQFPWQSPYCAFDNNPIYYIDPYGLSASVKGDPPPITMFGERSFNDPDADCNEMLYLPDNAENGVVATFIYQNKDKSTTTSTWTFATNEDGGRWEKGVTKTGTDGGSWGEGDYVGTDEVYDAKLLNIVNPVAVNTSTGGGLNVSGGAGKDQGGDSGGANTEGGSNSGSGDSDDDVIPDPPPGLDLNIPFIGNDKYFTPSDKATFLREVKQIGEYLNEYPDNKITLNIYTPGSKSGDVTKGKFKGSSIKHLMYQRYLRTRVILIKNYPKIKPGNVIFRPHYDQPKGTYKLEINFN